LANQIISNFDFYKQNETIIMKYVTYIVIALAVALIVLNITKLDFDNLFQGESVISLICIVAILCAVILLLIFNTSKAIDNKNN